MAYIDKIESEYLASASIGKPAANTTTYILNESLQVVPIGVHGEIYIGGSGLARGYLNRPDLTAERFINDPFSKEKGARLYRTGDLARYLPNGEMEYLGRIDDQVKIRGFRIELGEIESVISQFADVREAVVTTREEQKGDKRLMAYVVSRTESKIESAELRNYLREKLPDYMVPSAFVQLEKLPLTPNGKVDKKKLPAPEKDTLSDREEFVEPRTETEIKLAKIWSEMLGVDNIGIHDNFFDLGGHSLLAIRMFSSVEETFRKSVPLATLFEAGTIEKLAGILSQDQWQQDSVLLHSRSWRERDVLQRPGKIFAQGSTALWIAGPSIGRASGWPRHDRGNGRILYKRDHGTSTRRSILFGRLIVRRPCCVRDGAATFTTR